MAKVFDLHKARVACDSDQLITLAFSPHTMHWCGHSHPAFLNTAPVHPPTHLVRWIAGLNVKGQVEEGHLMAPLLTQEEERTLHLAAAPAAELMTKAAKTKGTVPFLPALLRSSTSRNM